MYGSVIYIANISNISYFDMESTEITKICHNFDIGYLFIYFFFAFTYLEKG